jgi:hypothetical protein
MGERNVLKEVAGDDTCDFCRESIEILTTIGTFAMELPTQICTSCYHECVGELTDKNSRSVSDWLDNSNSGKDNVGWEIITEIHQRSLDIKESGRELESFIRVGEMPPENAEYIPFQSEQ